MFDIAVGATSIVYAADMSLQYMLEGSSGRENLTFAVTWLACDEDFCFPPETRQFELLPNLAATGGEQAEIAGVVADGENPFAGFQVVSRSFGYQPVEKFVEFMQAGLEGRGATSNPLRDLLDRNLLLFVLAILAGGLALNLTPCVLPMIPINLGIIGAGAQASSRRRGFLLGGAYGLGIALAYGALGLISVITGAAFGALQSSPWFNGAIALIFVVLGLAMFDVFAIDFSRFQKPGAPVKAGTVGTAVGLGAISALLAGACVAPVLIWTLLLAADLHQAGSWYGILLPFVLGLGMALPWPFAGAGLSFLPKPGGWMNRVKYGFGVLVMLFALHYGRLAWQGFGVRLGSESQPVVEATAEATADETAIAWRQDIGAALDEARTTGKPVLVDLWATWCTACARMERSTLQDPLVVAEAENFVPLQIQCEQVNAPETRAIMDALGARGLPTYVILMPETNEQ